MATLVAVPQFTPRETPSIAKLAQLAAAVSFSYSNPALAQMTATSTTVTTSTSTAVTWTEAGGTDRDGGHSNSVNPTRYTAMTPGYYDMTAALIFPSNATGERMAFFRITTGSNNPGGAGVQTPFGMLATQADDTTNTGTAFGSLSPYLYLGDYVEVMAWQDSGGNLSITTGQWQLALVSLGP